MTDTEALTARTGGERCGPGRSARRVVVLTGASSGLGRAAALRFAAGQAHVVLAARRADALEEVARECRAAGGDTLVQPTDVTREEDVAALVEATLARHGRIDVWVNNAGVTLFAPLEEASFEEHRRVIETNLFHQLLPRTTERMILQVLRAWHFDDRSEPRTAGNIFAPDDDVADVHGTRPPLLGTPALLFWMARNLGRILWSEPAR